MFRNIGCGILLLYVKVLFVGFFFLYFNVVELFEVVVRMENMGIVNEVMVVEVIMIIKNDVDDIISLFCKFIIIWFFLMIEIDDDFGIFGL